MNNYPMRLEAMQSYRRFMGEWLFDHIDIPRQNIHIPDGTVAEADVPAFCSRYQRMIRDAIPARRATAARA